MTVCFVRWRFVAEHERFEANCACPAKRAFPNILDARKLHSHKCPSTPSAGHHECENSELYIYNIYIYIYIYLCIDRHSHTTYTTLF